MSAKNRKPKNNKIFVSSPYRDDPDDFATATKTSQSVPAKSKSHANLTSIESDSDFDKYNLYEWDVEDLDKLQDNRKSGFWKMSLLEIWLRLALFVAVVYINERGWVNPHDPNFIFADWKMPKITYDPFPNDSPGERKPFTFWGLIPEDPAADSG